MKKMMVVLTVLMCFTSTSAIAQLKEVRGVQTRMIEYYEYNSLSHQTDTKKGFEFNNENNYAIWVEAELWNTDYYVGINGTQQIKKAGIRDTKSFTLSAGETYIWKCYDKMEGEGHRIEPSLYYVKYKAYKAE